MSTKTIHFRDMVIGDILFTHDCVDIQFDYAIIVKNMDAAEEDTRWYGRGSILIEALWQQTNNLPDFPATLAGADIRDNQMIFRDEVLVPFSFQGNVGLDLRFADGDIRLTYYGESMLLTISEHEKYIEHIKAG